MAKYEFTASNLCENCISDVWSLLFKNLKAYIDSITNTSENSKTANK